MIAKRFLQLLPRQSTLKAFTRYNSSQKGSFSVTKTENGLMTLKLENVKKRNAMTFAMMKSMGDHLQAAADDPKCRGVVWVGTGDYFCSGMDLADFAEQSGILRSDMSQNEKLTCFKNVGGSVRALIEGLIDFPKPLIALVNGPAVGIGVTALAHCDLVIASDRASFNTPFTSLGFVVEACSSMTFPLLLGPQIANDMLLFGRVLSAEEALRHGLVSRVVPAKDGAELLAKTTETVGAIAKFPPGSLLASKRLLRNSPLISREALHKVNKEEMEAMAKQWLTPEVITVVGNFVNRRKKN